MKSLLPESYPVRFKATRGKVVVTLRKCQCTVGAEAAVKMGHDLLDVAEKALRRAGRIHKE